MNRKNSCPQHRRYLPPFERLLRRNAAWIPKKVKKERELQESCRNGELTPFKQPDNYSCYFIHQRTDILIVDQLIDEAKRTFNYTLDTEGDPVKNVPGTIQIEFIRPNSPSIVIVIEVNYLPPINSPLFMKIQQLCSIILKPDNVIYSWGSISDELKSFMDLNLFNGTINVDGRNVQNRYDRYEKRGLQAAIKYEYKQYLDKTATLAEWSCGVDLSLRTYMPQHVYGEEYDYREQEERKYRRILKDYAINDVFAVTKIAYDMQLINLLTPPTTVEAEEHVPEESTTQQEPSVELKPKKRDEPEAHEQVDLREEEHPGHSTQEESISIELELTPCDSDLGIFDYENESSPVEMEDEPMELTSQDVQPTPPVYEPISDDALPEIMQIHRPFRQPDPPREETTSTHEVNELRATTGSFYLGPQLFLPADATENQISSRIRRANRYRSEVICPIYRLFKYYQVRKILRGMSVQFLNINIRDGKVFIGVKSPTAADELKQRLGKYMFTSEHYYRYTTRRRTFK